MTDIRDFSIILFLIMLGVVAYLAHEKVIGNTGLIGGIAVAAIAAVIVGHFDQIARLTFQIGENRRILIETKQVKQEVDAKAEEIRRLAAGVATFSVASMLNENRFANVEHHETLLRRRDELQKFLADSGVDRGTADRLTGKITSLVDWDVRREIVVNAVASWLPRGDSPTDPRPRDAFQARLEAVLQKADRLSALAEAEAMIRSEPHMVERERLEEGVGASIRLYRQLLTSGRLPRIGAVDDLRHAPTE